MKIYNEVVIDMNPESDTFEEVLLEDSCEWSGEVALCGSKNAAQMDMSAVSAQYDPARQLVNQITGSFTDDYMAQMGVLQNFAGNMANQADWQFESGQNLYNLSQNYYNDAQQQIGDMTAASQSLMQQGAEFGGEMMQQGQGFMQQGSDMMSMDSEMNQQYKDFLSNQASNVAAQTAGQQQALFAQGNINPALANQQTEITNANAGRGVNESFLGWMQQQQAAGMQSQQLGAQQYGAGAQLQTGTASDAVNFLGQAAGLQNQAAANAQSGMMGGMQGYQMGTQTLGQAGGLMGQNLSAMGNLGQLYLGGANTMAGIGQNMNDAYAANIQAQNQASGGLMNMVGGLAGAALPFMLSDKKLKENIELVGKSDSGINIYEFEYIDKIYGEGRYRGVIAQEVPEASELMPMGYLAVDYSKIDINFERIS